MRRTVLSTNLLPHSVLALDVAGNCGWARVSGSVMVASGTWNLKGGSGVNKHDPAERLRALKYKLHEEHAKHQFDVIFFEQILGFTGSLPAIVELRHLEGVLMCECSELGIPL